MRFFFIIFILYKSSFAGENAALLFNGNCITCHNATKTISAPSAAELRDRYKKAFARRVDFVDYMSKWVKNPNANGSLMHDAIKKHGLMPDIGFDMQSLIEIAGYIYDTDFKKQNKKVF